ncbi:hypothetical protein [Owenweeksia hongkongensis]|uniref:hypothetical protein n=1 Tax=Owenweeksia hongkongensis TaxID=253245 RepID=UPI003A8F3D61
MNKLKLTFLTFLLSFCGFAQSEGEITKKLLFEAEAGVAIYDQIGAPPLSSFQMRFGSVANEYFSLGMLLNGYTATGFSYFENKDGDYDKYLTHGGRGGVFLRITGGTESHLFAELQGTVGAVFQVVGEDRFSYLDDALEFGGGINIGYNVVFANYSYFGLYAGAEFGNWHEQGNSQGRSEGYVRYNFGLRFQVRH